MSFKIRKMAPGDLDEVISIETTCFPSPLEKKDFERFVKEGYGFVCVLDGKIAGYVVADKVLDEAHLVRIAVSPGLRRRGIGRALLSELLSKGGRFYLEVRISNEPSIRLYESAGFRRVRVRKGYYSDKDEDAIVMEFSLPPQ